MLREVISKHIKPRIIPFQLTTTASTATVDIGYGDFTVTRTAAGTGVLSARQGFYRNALYFATQSVGLGGYATYNSTTSNNRTFPYSILNAAGSGVEGSCEGFCYGWDSPDLSLTSSQKVLCTQNNPRIIWGKVTGTTGAVAIGGSDFAVSRTSTGVYAITLKRAFGKTPVYMVTGVNASTTTVCPLLSSKTASSVTVSMTDASGTLADSDFYIMALGVDSRSDAGRNRVILQNSQRKPRIIAGQITNTSGTPSFSIGATTGGADFTSLVDNGTGDFSFNATAIFKREPAIFLTSTTQRAQVRSNLAAVNGLIRIFTQNAAGSNTDVDGVTNFFIIGSDDASSY